MPTTLNLEGLTELYAKCHEILEKTAFEDEKDDSVAFRIDSTVLVDILAWKVLIPILVSVTGGLLTNAVKAASRKKATDHAEDEAKTFLGKEIVEPNPENYRECVSRVEILLLPFGIKRQKVEYIVREIVYPQKNSSNTQ